MVFDWPTAKIERIAEKVGMGPFGSSIKVSTFIDEGIPVISGQHLNNMRLSDGEYNFITPEHAEKLKNANVFRGDIVFTHAGNIGQVAYIPDTSKYERYVISQRQFYMRCDLSKVIPVFITYFFKTPEGQYRLLANTSSSGVPSIARPVSYLKTIDVPVPPLPEQRAIAHILGALDDKIELNRRMNKTLEAMAKAIFKSWFVDFDPVRAKAEGRDPGLPDEIASLFPDSFQDSELGKIPNGWKVGVIGDIASTALGGQWGQDMLEGGLIPAVSLRGCDMEDLRSEGFAPKAPVRFFKQNAVERRLPNENELLIAASGAGPCGRPLWCAPLIKQTYNQPVIYSNFVQRFSTPGPEYAVYLDRLLFEKFQDRSIQDFITGTSVPNLDSKGLLKNCRIVIPPKQILAVFYKQNQSIFQKLYSEENVVLGQLRDTLLPKLISGELRVPDAEKFLEEVGL